MSNTIFHMSFSISHLSFEKRNRQVAKDRRVRQEEKPSLNFEMKGLLEAEFLKQSTKYGEQSSKNKVLARLISLGELCGPWRLGGFVFQMKDEKWKMRNEKCLCLASVS